MKAISVSLTVIVTLIMAVLAGLITWFYPLGWPWLPMVGVSYALSLWRWPGCWLAALPVLLLAVDLAPWMGWIFCDESDLALAITLAVGYPRLAHTAPVRQLTPAATLLLALFVAAFLINLYRLAPLPTPDFNALTDYTSPYNGLRVAKSLLWALLLLPLLRRTLTDDNVRRYLWPGLLTALAMVIAIVFWERLTFTGLLDFASDYRVTGSFSAMHTGGAALDGSLALLMPFSVLWLLQTHRPISMAMAILLVALGVYAVMATFSRGLYLGFGLTLALIGAHLLLGGQPSDRRPLWQSLLILVLMLLTGYLLTRVFATGGYRALAAALALLIAAMTVGAWPLPWSHRVNLTLGAVVCLSGVWLLWQGFAKGAYLAFALAATVHIAGLLALGIGRRPVGLTLSFAGFAGMAAGLGLVAWHWGGQAALFNAAPVIILAPGLALLNRRLPLWRWERSTWLGVSLLAATLGISIPIVGNYYMGERFSQASQDWQGRLQHWQAGLAMMDTNGTTTLFGMGIGKFPATYFWRNPIGEFPGNFQYIDEANNVFLRLGGPRHPRGYGEPLRIGQRVNPQAYALYTLSLDARSLAGPATLEVRLCQKWLLYPFNCSGNALKITGADWKSFDIRLNTLRFANDFWGARRTTQLVLANVTSNAAVDVDNLRLKDQATGENLLANGNFNRGNDYWFFTSDRNHLPWHIKNIGLNLLFDQGWIGLTLFGALTLLGLSRTWLQVRRGNRFALALLAALSSFLAVGLFDSLLDVPRLALLYYLLLFTALLEPFPAVPGCLAPQYAGMGSR